MYKRGDKRGLSTIIATLLVILLTLVAVGIVWVVIRNVIQSNAEQVSLGKFTLNLEIKSVTINVTGNSSDVKIKRNAGEGEISGLKFIFDDGENTEVVETNLSLLELEERTINLNLTSGINISKIQKVSVAPVFLLESGKEIIGDVNDEYAVPSSAIIGASCTPNCAGRVCGSDPVCGQSCGTCSMGYACNTAGQCICQQTCDLLGYECGNQIVCGVTTNCGSCPSGLTCGPVPIGQCIPI